MTQTILLSCHPNTPESDAALNYCLQQALQKLEVPCVFFVGHAVAHAFEQRNNNVKTWQSLGVAHQIPLYCCAHSVEQLLTSNTQHHNNTSQIEEKQLIEPFQTAGLGVLVEACVNNAAIISFASLSIPNTQNGSTPDSLNTLKTIDTASQHQSVAGPKTEKSIVLCLHSHDIMCHITMNALFNIALMFLIFEQKVTVHLQDKKSNEQTIDVNHWITHNASALANLKDMGMNSIILGEHLTQQFAKPLRDLGLCVATSRDISTNTATQTSQFDDENKDIYI